MTLLLAGLGAALGSLVRYWLTNYGKKHFTQNLPVATLVINLSGAFLLGLLFGGGAKPYLYALLGTGVLGGYTTFSTLNTELVALWHNHSYKTFWIYALLSYLGGIILVFIGFNLGR
ncbi:fluoride efflux transporter CrcB [Lactobacillus sp. ESL0679]|uniref:fluoride efflux transporter CrcB n=1 Tax=Lactobacillus sp. ESL0679 TaxID=2983209 RepID=UPI0023F617AA|nr:fluoride efflux transporter CrcB [Lactobacillus sp. ESL0679]MDF7683656.1 fluoride efflux transporter CrcB [Lactobacillus sp. ESL0679]